MRFTAKFGALLLAAGIGWMATAQSPDRNQLALQAAMKKETVDGDLKGAIEAYKKLAQAKDQAIAAKALVRMGECYERLGDAEARKIYERVLREFGNQKDSVDAARVRLAALGKSSSPSGPTMRPVSASGFSHSDDGRIWLESGPDGELDLRDLQTGQTRHLAKKPWYDAAISADGRRVAFFRQTGDVRELRIVGADGSGERVLWKTDQGEVAWGTDWLPDDKRIIIAVVPKGLQRLLAISATDGSATTLWDGKEVSYNWIDVSPDGKSVIYTRTVRQDPRADELRLLRFEDRNDTVLFEAQSYIGSPTWTPDGTGVVYMSDRRKPGAARDLWYLAVANGKAQGRPELLKADIGDSFFRTPITRDGTLYYTQVAEMREVLSVEIDPAAGKAIGPAVTMSGREGGPAGQGIYSPDGRWLAYSRRLNNESRIQVLRNLDTGEEKSISGSFLSAFELAWFADSRSLVVNGRKSAREPLGLYRVDVATGASTLMKAGRFGASFAFSPDGKTFYYSQRQANEGETRVMAWEFETGKERELIRGDGLGPTHWIGIAVSPDGKQLATNRIDANGHVIEIQPAAGGSRREVYRVRDRVIHEVHWSPDGKYLLFGMRNGDQEGLWRIAVTGGSPQEMGISARTLGKVSIHPDGRHIAYVAAQGGSMVLALENFLPKARVSK